ncbi:MAG: hypothetical protein ACM31L_04210 [Actinomycetota bacterium]
MSVSATSPTQQAYDQPFDRLVPTLPSENAATAFDGADKSGHHVGMFAEDEPSFKDLFDIINPLQHIPVVDTIYRELTGEKIGVGPRLLGGALYGGPIGLIAAAVESITEEATGKDIGGNVLALFKGDESEPADGGTMLASAADTEKAAAPDAAAARDGAQPVVIPDLLGGPGPTAPAAAAPPPAPAAAPAATSVAATGLDDGPPAADKAVAKPDAKPTSLFGREPRFMPVPNRAAPPLKPLPPAGLPISNSNSRTNVPVTGRPVAANGAVNPFLSQQVMAQESKTVATPSGPPQDWFQSAVMQAMDKYERSAKLGQQKASVGGETVAEP